MIRDRGAELAARLGRAPILARGDLVAERVDARDDVLDDALDERVASSAAASSGPRPRARSAAIILSDATAGVASSRSRWGSIHARIDSMSSGDASSLRLMPRTISMELLVVDDARGRGSISSEASSHDRRDLECIASQRSESGDRVVEVDPQGARRRASTRRRPPSRDVPRRPCRRAGTRGAGRSARQRNDAGDITTCSYYARAVRPARDARDRLVDDPGRRSDAASETMTSDDDLVDVMTVIPDAVLDIRYATTDNFTGDDALSEHATCKLRRTVAAELAVAAKRPARARSPPDPVGLLPAGLGSERSCGSIIPIARYVADPKIGLGPQSRRGVDIGIVDSRRQAGHASHGVRCDVSRGASRSCARRRHGAEARKLDAAMTEAGFVGIRTEWWHYDFTMPACIRSPTSRCKLARCDAMPRLVDPTGIDRHGRSARLGDPVLPGQRLRAGDEGDGDRRRRHRPRVPRAVRDRRRACCCSTSSGSRSAAKSRMRASSSTASFRGSCSSASCSARSPASRSGSRRSRSARARSA